MKRLACVLSALTPILLAFSSAFAGDIKVVANFSVAASGISVEELRGIFLVTKTSLSDGEHVEPVLLRSGAAHDEFLRRYVGKSETALETYYRTLVFTGKGFMPKALDSDAELVAYIARTKGAIGYVSAATPAYGVKVLAVK
jgi:ABC-type phosphate transport system substrate-binding protein